MANKGVVVLLALAVLLAAGAVGTAPTMVARLSADGSEGLLRLPALARQAGALVAAACALIVILLELWPRGARVVTVTLGGVSISYATDALREIAEREILTVEGVEAARVEIETHGANLRVLGRIRSAASSDPQHVAVQAAERLRDRLTRAFGLKIESVRFSVKPAAPRGASVRAESSHLAS